MDVVKGDLVRWTKSSRSLDTYPLRAFIIKSIRSFIICIFVTMWGRAMSAVNGRLTSGRSGLLGAWLPFGPSWYPCLHLCLLDPLLECYVPRSFDAAVLPDRYFVW